MRYSNRRLMPRWTVLGVGFVATVATIAYSQNPLQGMKDAWKNAKQQSQPQQQSQPKPGQTAAKPGQAAASGGINATGPFTPPAGVKIDPLVMAPAQNQYTFVLSPWGVHTATTSQLGSRQVIIADGQTGPKFDQLLGPPIYSADGNHWAYCARIGSDWFVMLDGKELNHNTAPPNFGIGQNLCWMGFTSNNKHFYYISTGPEGSPRFVWDGKASPPGAPASINTEYAFSPDGDHFAYIWGDPTSRTPKTVLIVDGKPAGYDAGNPQWSADSQHLFTKRTVRVQGTRTGQAQEVLYDGKPIMRADWVEINVPPAGNMVVFKVRSDATNPATTFLVIGGKKIPGSETTGQIGIINFSPDGKHFAADYTLTSRHWIFADGKKGEEYMNIVMRGRNQKNVTATYTADSSTLVYEAPSPTQQSEFMVVNGQESEQLISVTNLEFAPVGGHFASQGWGQITVDGKIVPLAGVNPRTQQASQLSWSPDGSHYAFILGHVYLDGVPNNDYAPVGSTEFIGTGSKFYTWSPDGKHIAYFCHSSNPAAGDDTYLCLDNKAVKVGGNPLYTNLIFSSDSNHLYFARNQGQSKVRVFVDGQPVVEGLLPVIGGLSKQAWEVGPDGSLIVLLQDPTSMIRYTITPSSSTSIATLFGGGTAVAKGN